MKSREKKKEKRERVVVSLHQFADCETFGKISERRASFDLYFIVCICESISVRESGLVTGCICGCEDDTVCVYQCVFVCDCLFGSVCPSFCVSLCLCGCLCLCVCLCVCVSDCL